MLGTLPIACNAVSLGEVYVSSHSHKFRKSQNLSTATALQIHADRNRSFSCKAQHRQQNGRSVLDAQETELAAADQQAKQDLYAQLLDRQQSSRSSEVSSSQPSSPQQASVKQNGPEQGSTELIFRLERRGEGWGEEIFPHLVVEQRPWATTAKRDRNRSTRPKPWTVCSVCFNHFFIPPAAYLPAVKLCCIPNVHMQQEMTRLHSHKSW